MTEPVLSVNLLIGLGIFGVVWCIWYILNLDKNEEENRSNSHSSTSSNE